MTLEDNGQNCWISCCGWPCMRAREEEPSMSVRAVLSCGGGVVVVEQKVVASVWVVWFVPALLARETVHRQALLP
jgi:hypothetical protein